MKKFIWYEKHRPKSLKDMTLPKEYRKAFRTYIKQLNIPHLLLAGPQGSGKTTLAYIFMDNVPCTRMVLNASSKDRGIDTIKNKVKTFASSQPDKGKIKIILFDEADALTQDAQMALRNTIEAYSDTCRFILTANYPDKIIPALHSRCTKYLFNQLPKKRLLPILMNILELEGIDDVDEDKVQPIIDRHFPDIRTIINELQGACITGDFNPDHSSTLKIDFSHLALSLSNGELKKVREAIAGTIDYVWLYKALYEEFVSEYCKTSDDKAEVSIIIGKYLAQDSTIPDRGINFDCCVLEIMTVIGAKIKFEDKHGKSNNRNRR